MVLLFSFFGLRRNVTSITHEDYMDASMKFKQERNSISLIMFKSVID